MPASTPPPSSVTRRDPGRGQQTTASALSPGGQQRHDLRACRKKSATVDNDPSCFYVTIHQQRDFNGDGISSLLLGNRNGTLYQQGPQHVYRPAAPVNVDVGLVIDTGDFSERQNDLLLPSAAVGRDVADLR